MTKTGRNEPCPCDSGKKYKRCCWEVRHLPQTHQKAIDQAEADRRAEAMRQELEAMPPEERAQVLALLEKRRARGREKLRTLLAMAAAAGLR